MATMEIIGKTLTRLFSTSSERYVKKHSDFIAEINALEPECARLTDEQLREKTDHFKAHIKQKQDQLIGMPLRDRLREIQLLPEEARRPAKKQLSALLDQCCSEILPEAFAVVREASDRHLGIRNVFDDQYDFDPSILTSQMQHFVFDPTKKEVSDGRSVHQISLPPDFYAEVRKHYPADKRPPFRFRHFDVQMIGGNVLYQGKIAEMATGEGKTLVATLAAYVVALSGRKVHIITVNDYLAQRDRDWMGPVYEALGLTVGAI